MGKLADTVIVKCLEIARRGRARGPLPRLRKRTIFLGINVQKKKKVVYQSHFRESR